MPLVIRTWSVEFTWADLGDTLFLRSSVGVEVLAAVKLSSKELGVAECFSGYLPKPTGYER